MTSPGAAALITERGGRLYVWVTKFHCCGGAVRIVCSSPGALRGLTEFRRFEAAEFQVLLHPSIGRAPAQMDIRLLGRWRPRITLYWDGMPIRCPRAADAAEFIRAHGGQLFVWPTEHRSARLTLALVKASVDPPLRALDFRRVEAAEFLLFMHPALKTLPEELLVVLRGRRHPHIEAYWDGLAYIVP